MSGLLGSLTAAARALEAQQYGLDMAGQNIANVNTPGYARREVLLSSVPPADQFSAGGGVDVVGVRATRDRLLERRLQMERPAEQREGAIADSLSLVEVAIGKPGESIDAQMNVFFDAAARLAAEPTSSIVRNEFVSAAERMTAAFREMVSRLDTARREADANVRASVDEINDLLAGIATLNGRTLGAGSTNPEGLAVQEQQKVLLDKLAGVLDINVLQRADGGVDVTTSTGLSLVLGSDVNPIVATPAPPSNLVDLTYEGRSITKDITGGRLGGFLQVRDTLLPDYVLRLDDIASALVTEVNAIQQTGYDADGVLGGPLLTVTPGLGAAASIAVDAAIVADPSKVAAAGSPVRGDNQNARTLAALRDVQVVNGATLGDAWAQLVYRVGSDAQAARQEQQSREDIVRQVEALQDSVSGVSLDEEAMTMMRFQRAYEANARFFQAIDQTIQTLLNAIGR